MAKFLKYSGICALVLGIVAFILMMATPSIIETGDYATHLFPGTTVIFGGKGALISGDASLSVLTYKGSPLALIGWILTLIALIIILAGVILPLLKINALEKVAGILNLVAVIMLILAGVFMFLAIPTFSAANDNMNLKNYGLGAGWVIGGILCIAAGAIAILPAVMDFASKRK